MNSRNRSGQLYDVKCKKTTDRDASYDELLTKKASWDEDAARLATEVIANKKLRQRLIPGTQKLRSGDAKPGRGSYRAATTTESASSSEPQPQDSHQQPRRLHLPPIAEI